MDALFDQGPPPPCPEPFNLAEYVLAPAGATPDKIALAVLGLNGAQRWSYARLHRAVLGTATGLRDRGAEPGQRVLIRLGNTVEFPIVYLAAIAAGLVPVPTSAQLTAAEISAVAAEIDPALVVADAGIALPEPPMCPVVMRTDLAAMHDLPPAEPVRGAADRPGYILYTSGTAGQPRAVVHAHRAVWARRMMWDGWYGLTAADRMLHTGAFNWSYTLGTGLLDPWAAGATALIPAEGVAPSALPLLAARHDATILASVPGIYRQLLKAPLPPMPRLRHALSAGEKMPETTRHAWTAATGRPVFEAFGMSECSTFISAAPGRPAPPGSIGYPQTGRRVAIVSQDGAVLPAGEEGIIAVSRRDPGLMLGYLDQPQETAARFRGEWFLTGDSATMAPDGAVSYLGRADDMMNAGGYRVSPIEVESAMRALDQVLDCAAVEVRPRPDVSVIALFYTARTELAEDELAAHAARVLARYKQPRIFRRIAQLPRGTNGKLLRKALRALGTTDTPA